MCLDEPDVKSFPFGEFDMDYGIDVAWSEKNKGLVDSQAGGCT